MRPALKTFFESVVLWMLLAYIVAALEVTHLLGLHSYQYASFLLALAMALVFHRKSRGRYRHVGIVALLLWAIVVTYPNRSTSSTYWRLRPIAVKAFGGMGHVDWQQVVQHAARGGSFESNYYGVSYRGDAADWIDWRVFQYSRWEPQVIEFLGEAARSLGRDRVVFVDVGASTGLHSLYMRNVADEVHAFDPYPPVIERFRQTIVENQVMNIVLHPVGLGDANATLEFHVPTAENMAVGSFAAARRPGLDTIEAPVVVADEYFPEHGIRDIAIVKIDVEGYEKPVLQGMSETLGTSRPIVVMELTLGSDIAQRFKSLPELIGEFPAGYHLYAFVNRQDEGIPDLFELAEFAADFGKEWRQFDVVAVPAEVASTRLILGHLSTEIETVR